MLEVGHGLFFLQECLKIISLPPNCSYLQLGPVIQHFLHEIQQISYIDSF